MSTIDEIRSSGKQIHTDVPTQKKETFQKDSSFLIQKAIRHTNQEREKALEESKSIVEDIFGNQMLDDKKLSGSSKKETDEVIKKFFKSGTTQTMQWLSYEGSLIVSALIGVSNTDVTTIRMEQFPECDKILLQNNILKCSRVLTVMLDQYQNFIFRNDEFEETGVIFGNRVANIPPEESVQFGNGSDVKVEQKGREILIGDRIKIEKERLQTLLQKPDSLYHPHAETQLTKGFQPRPKISGRNAYEIRSDVLEMAVDWAKHENKGHAEDVVEIANLFYKFVEHK